MNGLRFILLSLILFGFVFWISPFNVIPELLRYHYSKNYIYKNVESHGSFKTYLIDNNREKIKFTPYAFQDYPRALSTFDSLKNHFSSVQVREDDKWEFKKKSFDIDRHIKNSLCSWNNSPYDKKISFKNFLEFVLPYRAGDEALVEYRDSLNILFARFKYKVQDDSENLDNLVDSINSQLATLVDYDIRSLATMNVPDPLETLEIGKGSCKSLTQLATLSLRTLGIATTIDECPFWAHRASGHQWNVYLSNDQQWIPFNGSERNPDCFDPFNDSIKAPKIFRHTYSFQDNFSPTNTNKENIPPYFRMKNRIDVTSSYVSTSNISLYIKDKPDDTEHVYLSVFNNQDWKIISWSKLDGNQAHFDNMGNNNIIYLPVFYINGRKKPAGKPFLVDGDKITTFELKENKFIDTDISTVNYYYDHQWNTSCAVSGATYRLNYWDDEWLVSQEINADINGHLKFKNVPEDGLYFISSGELNNRQQRLFSLKDGAQSWY
ncbi:transglutaminase-like domain-containing protein [Portibacter lacus]|uniref:Transglutaminase-like domain-containing protein n=1 Tax=Portibacter lacus TaxID=1099794 RepID=A0AA37SNL9_9BACT|nr:transglutaminase-like domain-containing protein [Portibacter lacus]GLR16477.1 hypothetical protein GCM10007940_10920 [Portibacter lacus]